MMETYMEWDTTTKEKKKRMNESLTMTYLLLKFNSPRNSVGKIRPKRPGRARSQCERRLKIYIKWQIKIRNWKKKNNNNCEASSFSPVPMLLTCNTVFIVVLSCSFFEKLIFLKRKAIKHIDQTHLSIS